MQRPNCVFCQFLAPHFVKSVDPSYTVNLMRCGLCAQIGFKPVKRSKFETGAARSKKAPSGSLVAKKYEPRISHYSYVADLILIGKMHALDLI